METRHHPSKVSGGRPKAGSNAVLEGIDMAIARTSLPEASLALLGLEDMRPLIKNALVSLSVHLRL